MKMCKKNCETGYVLRLIWTKSQNHGSYIEISALKTMQRCMKILVILTSIMFNNIKNKLFQRINTEFFCIGNYKEMYLKKLKCYDRKRIDDFS